MIKGFIRRIRRNEISLGNKKSMKNKINLEWWDQSVNLGDTLALVVYKWMLGRKQCPEDKGVKKTTHLMTIGSLIGMKNFNATIWGTGLHCFKSITNIFKNRTYVKYDIRAVRGPITREILISNGYECPEIFGDPAVLMPLIYNNKDNKKKYKHSIVYHLDYKEANMLEECHYINIRTDDYKAFIDEILASEVVISSSLHGIILAEAYGVPAIFLKAGMDNQLLKFYDWYYSTGRINVRMARTLNEALEMEPMELPDLQDMQEKLLQSFPYDLWA